MIQQDGKLCEARYSTSLPDQHGFTERREIKRQGNTSTNLRRVITGSDPLTRKFPPISCARESGEVHFTRRDIFRVTVGSEHVEREG